MGRNLVAGRLATSPIMFCSLLFAANMSAALAEAVTRKTGAAFCAAATEWNATGSVLAAPPNNVLVMHVSCNSASRDSLSPL